MPRKIYNPKEEYYNDAWKRAFIEDYKKKIRHSFWDHLFYTSKPTEIYYEKDLSEFNLGQIISLLQGYRAASENALRIKVSLLRSYTQFCIQNNLAEDKINHYGGVDSDIILNCIDKTKSKGRFMTPEQLRKCLNTIRNYRDKFLVLCVYEGVCGKELGSLLEIKTGDFEYENGYWFVNLRGNRKKISWTLKKYEEEAYQEDAYEKLDGKQIKYVNNGDYIIKAMSVANSMKLNEKALFRLLDNLHKKYNDFPITFIALRYSGFMETFHDLVKEKGDFLTAIGTYAYQDLLVRYGLSNTNLKTKQLYDDYLAILEEERYENPI